MNFRLSQAALAAAVVFSFIAPAFSAEGDVSFDIVRFQVDGNSLLPVPRVQQLVAPFIGRNRQYGDVQKALEALDREYHKLGFGTVNVYVPEQELTSGVVRIQVTEAVVGKVLITGNKFFNADNVRASLPQLVEGKTPNMRQMSENVQLANENPAKQVEVTLGVSEEEGKVNARIEVTEEDPDRYYVTVDNTGTKASGRHRIGVSYQNSNLGNRDQVLTLNYITAIEPPNGVKVDIFSAGYRLPLYQIGDSIDFIYANSSANTPGNVLAPGGTLGVNGKGEVFAFRYNHIFAREGEYSSRLVAGLDYKYINSTCATAGAPVAFGTAGCTPYTLRPVTLTYSGNWVRPGELIDFSIGGTYHAFPMGSEFAYAFANGAGGTDRYSAALGRRTKDNFAALRYSASYTKVLPQNVMLRGAFSGQHAQNALVGGEQIGLAGSSAVRGFYERAVATDRGYFANLELYSPDYGPKLGLVGAFKVLAFYDWAEGQNLDQSGDASRKAHIASAGLGMRYNFKKDISFKLDVANVFDGYRAASAAGQQLGKTSGLQGHFSFAYGF